ncbi:class I SAM-dependent methyltransferase [Longimicrobium sp.]|jgi:SAM-dependent methyltransferase|uniref:class I SAM-dependent methyltransferase n=1 Tax=Longimicrobium sp. TaxID=2029185 RepID=UPI002F947500
MNPFVHRTAADRYSRGRPFFHPVVMELVATRVGMVDLALDVGCGTGLSSRAVGRLARRVVGIDASPAMVARAPRDEGMAFAAASAGLLPFAESAFGLLTLSQVIHWLNWERFMAQARRVVRAGGWVLAYDNWFGGLRGERHDEFDAWWRGEYLLRYPSPPRAAIRWDDEDAWRADGFGPAHLQRYRNDVVFSRDALLDYLVTQSNVIAAVEGGGGGEDIASARRWIADTTSPFFPPAGEAAFSFTGPIAILRRTAPPGAGRAAG